MALHFGNKRGLDYTTFTKILSSLSTLKDAIQYVLLHAHNIEKIAKKYSQNHSMFFLGRNMFYPIAME
jgi:glucosamine 6-phosphate synthetase-like amidotransferase/phosphosugar isomerase protein